METPTTQQNGKFGMHQKLLEAGAHIGHQKSRGHPKMKPYLFAVRQGVQIINVEKTADRLEEAKLFLRELVSRGGTVLCVATKVPGKLFIKQAAVETGMPYVTERWLGGTFTNFPVILKRLEYFLSQESKKKQGEWEKYPKKERVLFERELETFEKKMGGLRSLKKVPDALLVVDIADHIAAIRESKKSKVPVVAISDTNTDPTMVTYPIPANDRSGPAVKLILEELTSAMKEGKRKAESGTGV